MSVLASGQRSTDSTGAGGAGAPGLRPPHRTPPRGGCWARSMRCAAGAAPSGAAAVPAEALPAAQPPPAALGRRSVAGRSQRRRESPSSGPPRERSERTNAPFTRLEPHRAVGGESPGLKRGRPDQAPPAPARPPVWQGRCAVRATARCTPPGRGGWPVRPHMYPPRPFGVARCAQRLAGPKSAGGERLCMGNSQTVGFPIQSGRIRLAPYVGHKGTWSWETARGPPTGELAGASGAPCRPWRSGTGPPAVAAAAPATRQRANPAGRPGTGPGTPRRMHARPGNWPTRPGRPANWPTAPDPPTPSRAPQGRGVRLCVRVAWPGDGSHVSPRGCRCPVRVCVHIHIDTHLHVCPYPRIYISLHPCMARTRADPGMRTGAAAAQMPPSRPPPAGRTPAALAARVEAHPRPRPPTGGPAGRQLANSPGEPGPNWRTRSRREYM